MRRRLAPAAALALLAVLAAGAAAPRAHGRAATFPHVTLIGDSVADSLINYVPARNILQQETDLDLEVAPCRRVDQQSCPYNGVRPPTVVDLVASMGAKLGPTVIVSVGYNDFHDEYAHNIATALDAMKKAGIKRVLWMTLRAARHDYLDMNDDILQAAATHPFMTVVDWNLYSRSHPDWFQDDGIHLEADGATAMASLLHNTLRDLGIIGPQKVQPPGPPVVVVTTRLPPASKGKMYNAHLAARGGRRPYFWSLPGQLPNGLHMRPTGWLFGVPRGRAGTFHVAIRVSDVRGKSAARKLVLRIRP